MDWSPISKPRGSLRREPNLGRLCRRVPRSSPGTRRGRSSTACPMAVSILRTRPCSATCRGRAADQVAIRFLAQSQAPSTRTYRELATDARRFANVLRRLGVQRGDCVASLLGRVPPLYAAVLGTLAAGAVYCPLFSAFGPEPVKTRLAARFGTRTGHDRPAVPAQGRTDPRRAARSCSMSWSCGRRARATCRSGRSTSMR